MLRFYSHRLQVKSIRIRQSQDKKCLLLVWLNTETGFPERLCISHSLNVISKTQLSKTLGNVLWMTLRWEGYKQTRQPPEVPSNLIYSVILGFCEILARSAENIYNKEGAEKYRPYLCLSQIH